MKAVASAIGALLLLSGCASGTEVPIVAETHSPTPSASEPLTQTPSEDLRPALEENFVSNQVSECRLQDAREIQRQPNNVGFPLSPAWVPTSGDARFLVIPVSFSDTSGQEVPLERIKAHAAKVTDWYTYTSQGKLQVEFELVETWVELDQPSTDFDFEKSTANVAPTEADRIRNRLQTQLLESVVSNLDSGVEISGLDAIFMVFPDRTPGVKSSILQRGVDLKSTREVETLMAWGTGADVKGSNLEWALWIHELLHDQGLSLHAPGNGSDFGLGQNQFAWSSTLSGWEQFKLGWISDNEVLCLDLATLGSDSWTFNLNPMEVPATSPRLAILKLSDYEAVVVESRRPVAYSAEYEELIGAVVYRIDTRLDNDRASECCEDYGNDPEFDKWAFLLAPDHVADSKQSTGNTSNKFIFRELNVVSFENFELELTQSAKIDSFTIRPKSE